MNSKNIIDSLNKLKPDQNPLWGKMSPQHMVEHLYQTVQASINEIELGIFSEEKRIPVLKRIFLGERELPKEYMNPAIGPDLLKLEFKDLQTAIVELKKIISKYDDYFKQNPLAKSAHPIFGYLSKEEWDKFHEKHFRHHHSQFGISYST